jgi:hypothetical protein
MLSRYPVAFLLLTACFLPAGAALAETLSVSTGLGAGYRVDHLQWNTAGTAQGTNPNVLSELTWDDVQCFQITGMVNAEKSLPTMPFDLIFQGSLGYGWALDGQNRDSDYGADNRSQEFSRSENSADDSLLFDVKTGVGLRFVSEKKRLAVTPLLGWSYNQQKLTMTDGLQTVSMPGVTPLGPIDGMHSTYKAEWSGPWVGMEFQYETRSKMYFALLYELHLPDYDASADWNLRTDYDHPVSFRHTASDGIGHVLVLSARYGVSESTSFSLTLNYQDWEIDSGIHEAFLANGGTLKTRLNEVDWESYAVMLEVNYVF